MTGTIFRIERFAIHDGPGIRTTVFFKGCPLRCAWCHSPESQSPRPQFMPLADRCIGCGTCVAACPNHALGPVVRGADGRPVVPLPKKGARPCDRPDPADVKDASISDLAPCRVCGTCVEACPTGARVLAGEAMSVAAVIDAVERDRVFYDESGGGVTFSGGEPLMQAAFLAALVDECRARRIHVAVDTSGFGNAGALDKIRPDLFLFDVKAIDDARHRKITGVSNRVILENLARLAARTRAGGTTRPASLIVRFPLVPGVTDGDANIRAIARLVSSLGIVRVDVLPYHRAGLAKYGRLGKAYKLPDTEPPTVGDIERAVNTFRAHRLTVRAGGA